MTGGLPEIRISGHPEFRNSGGPEVRKSGNSNFRMSGNLEIRISGCGLQMDGFSAHSDQYESILDHFLDFGHFGVVSDGLTLFPEGPRTFQDRPEGSGTL